VIVVPLSARMPTSGTSGPEPGPRSSRRTGRTRAGTSTPTWPTWSSDHLARSDRLWM